LQRNPDIILCGLSWGYPGWLSHEWWEPYDKPNRTADYIARWVMGAKNVYNLDIDYVGVSVALQVLCFFVYILVNCSIA